MRTRVLFFLVVLALSTKAVAYHNGFPQASLVREVIADAPYRIEPTDTPVQVPVLIFINDAGFIDQDNTQTNKPYHITNISIFKDGVRLIYDTPNLLVEGSKRYNLYKKGSWYKVFYISSSEFSGDSTLNVVINGFDVVCNTVHHLNDSQYIDRIECVNKTQNFEYTLGVKKAMEEMPKFDNWYCGDTHYHTVYTDDPAPFNGEVGAPVDVTMEAGKIIGLDWTSANTHSEDLSDYKWSDSEYGLTNVCTQKDGFVCIPGEEISCGWHCVSNVCIAGVSHYLAYDISDWIGGSAVGVMKPCEWVVNNVNVQGGVGYAAHPMDHYVSIGSWIGLVKWQDYTLDFNGLEVWNIESETSKLEDGLKEYDRALMNNLSRRIFISGGSDAQGFFNEIFGDTTFGKPRTCCYMTSNTRDNILGALRNGHCFFGNGPALKFTINGKQIGDTVNIVDGENISMSIEWKSTEEFDKVDKTNTTSQIVFICCLKGG